MAPIKVILLASGSFNPPTNMHLRMFEIARDNLNRLGQYLVIGGIISPVHDSYGKKDLAPASYRYEMLKLALQSSDWIKVSNWECCQESWTTTKQVLQYHQNLINSIMNNEKNENENDNHINANEVGFNPESLITNDIRNSQGPVQIKMLCGADLLHSFDIPGLWNKADIEMIVRQHGLVVISRQGYDPYHVIYESDLLTRNQSGIIVINNWITNDVSSTKIRRALGRQESVKYLIDDSVIDFIKRNGLYGCLQNNVKYYCTPLNQSLSIPSIDDFILTPSPSDVNMKSVNSSETNIYFNVNSLKQSESEPNEIGRKESDSPIKTRKVGFLDDERSVISSPKDESDEFRSPECSNISDEPSLPVNQCKHSINGANFRKGLLSKTESDAVNKCHGKSLILRRSNSDAVVSRRIDGGEAASVKIQFTKDGIKVISDKESIV